MRKLFITSIVAFCATLTYAQGDFFGSLAPKKKTVVVNLPNKPNKVDAQGRKQGEWAKKYPNGRYAYVATFVNDIPVDTIKRYYDTGVLSMYQIYNGDTCNVINFSSIGEMESSGIYVNEKKEGLWTFYNPDGSKISQTNFKADAPDGVSQTYYPTGELLETITYKDGVKHGDWFRYYKTGTIQIKATYYNDKLHGHYRVINGSGDVSAEGVYNKGVCVGEWKHLDTETRQIYIKKYDNNGKLLNKEEINDRNQKRLEYHDRNRHSLDDPALHINDPSTYNF
jgi:antitoxin component YwqK of YwqJK toxin-antitoxin module